MIPMAKDKLTRARELHEKAKETLIELQRKRRMIEQSIDTQHKTIRQTHANIILALPVGAEVHYDGYTTDAKWHWISERTGKIIRTGIKYVVVDFGDRGKVKILARELAEGAGKRNERTAESLGKLGSTVDTMLEGR